MTQQPCTDCANLQAEITRLQLERLFPGGVKLGFVLVALPVLIYAFLFNCPIITESIRLNRLAFNQS